MDFKEISNKIGSALKTGKDKTFAFFGDLFKKKANKAETAATPAADIEVNDDSFEDISGGVEAIEERIEPDPLEEPIDLFEIADISSEFFNGELSKKEENELFKTSNFQAVPDRVEKGTAANEALEQELADTAVAAPRRSEQTEKDERKARFNKRMNKFWKIWTYVRVPIIIAASLFIVYFLVKKVGTKLYTNYIMPVDPNDPTPVVVTIPTGSGASAIAKILYEAGGEDEKGLISHKAVFKVYVDFIGKSSRLQAGTYVLSRNMSIPDIVDTICRGVPPKKIIKLRIPEGMTIEAMAAKLVEDGVLQSPDRFIQLCVTGEAFVQSHPFIAEIPQDDTGERRYVLEGFLFPDTYEVYEDATEETIIDKMLTRFEQIFGSVYTARAQELGLSMYQVVTLASTLEKEARLNDDFARVSAVFYNRMRRNMNLDSDATLEYVLHTGSLNLTDEQLATPSGYNTHINSGLPLGPISNPGDTALNAALYPNQEYINEQYLFFCLMNPENGALIFAKTIEEHNANVAKYSPLW